MVGFWAIFDKDNPCWQARFERDFGVVHASLYWFHFQLNWDFS